MKWLIMLIGIGEAVLIVAAITYEDGFITACAIMCGLIFAHEWNQYRHMLRMNERMRSLIR